jgi:hypothetical protein
MSDEQIQDATADSIRRVLAEPIHIGDIPAFLYGPFAIFVGVGWPWWARLVMDTGYVCLALASWMATESLLPLQRATPVVLPEGERPKARQPEDFCREAVRW